LRHLFKLGEFGHFIASITAMKLEENGLIDIEKPISQQITSDWTFGDENMTVKSLLTGNSGIFGPKESTLKEKETKSLDSILSKFSIQKASTMNPNFSIGADAVLEKLILDAMKGKAYYSVLKETILDKYDIETLKIDDLPKRNLIFGNKKEFQIEPSYNHVSILGIWCTTSDVARILTEVMKSTKKISNEMLTEKSVEKYFNLESNASNLYGVSVSGENENLKFQYQNKKDGFSYNFVAFPNIGKGAVIISNSETGYELINEITRSIAHTYHWPDLKQEIKKPLKELNTEKISKHFGIFHLNSEKKCQFSKNENRIYFSYLNFNMKEEVFTDDYKTFYNESGLRFHFDQENNIVIQSPSIGNKIGKFAK
jgi:hypothetical protein